MAKLETTVPDAKCIAAESWHQRAVSHKAAKAGGQSLGLWLLSGVGLYTCLNSS